MYSYREHMFNGGELICLIAHCTDDDDDDGGLSEKRKKYSPEWSRTKSRST